MNDLITEEANVGCSVLQFPCSGVDSNHQGPPNASDALQRSKKLLVRGLVKFATAVVCPDLLG